MLLSDSNIIYEDNHIIAVDKQCGQLVQGDITGDVPLAEALKVYLKEKYQKPGNVYVGVTHRLDRPVSGVVLFSKTSKALPRLNNMFRDKEIDKSYLAIVKNMPEHNKGLLKDFLLRNHKQNKSYVSKSKSKEAKEAVLDYELIANHNSFFLLKINLHTGRHHQIRVQLAHMGCPIVGDLKYGYAEANKNGGINLHAYKVEFIHPVKKEHVLIKANLPKENLWQVFRNVVETL